MAIGRRPQPQMPARAEGSATPRLPRGGGRHGNLADQVAGSLITGDVGLYREGGTTASTDHLAPTATSGEPGAA
jgi:hypothetical protein